MGAGLVRQRAAALKDEALVRVADRMKSSTRRMSRMIEQILDLTRSRLAGGLEVKPESMDLVATLSAIIDELRAANPSRRIDLRCAPTLTGSWDRDRLEQVFSNLIGNAINYGDAEKPVTVDVQEQDGAISVVVHNFGRPIPEALRVEIFSPFRRGERDSKTTETEGLGLGLYISSELVVAHGGAIDVQSTLAEGTTFRVRLPRASCTSRA
jgi:signal transduction histidine kinase